ncbi:aminotransferase class V-fold PLP-dependent enzyme [Stutzerimonas balearica]|uniref:aminotransferase class V-fold PLP-dependent enzyme n=1 Tax=Stutzerimonas balearica TaxID=74829 RepID=UPI001909307A|nr:aminotransferase class V-fold PLP-dependent enzyme [Stutzerimonas balearica]WIX01733.1 aminotransferase class V-fold PLP-dependent enzyme [Pseudomonas sp. AR5]MBC7200022.1 aminotransferase class V-fold PLP-dependent enzyme [Stutzerimonas balearica]MBK3749158.1 aminotransferase class V-fold PLP-dependent enzyme [Stutzerimonas balearica]MBK3827355.1 aminotransferase class V-fold PLP-dependent enzyme [Stutzerimonas balearica]MBK3857045.1 aminotransferase class V-fold PLP-dependent enzyme [Stut
MLLSPWRADFPALSVLEAQGQVYLDSAATAQKPQAMIDALAGYYTCGAANVHRAQHQPAERATRAFEASRIKVAKWLNASSPTEIVFTRGATEALNLLAYGLEHLIGAGDEIVISALEHHANLLPWQQLALRRGAKLVVLPLDTDGRIDLDAAQRLIGPRTRLLAVSQLSNVLGSWQPLQPLLDLARRNGALSVVDGAQGVVHGRHDLQTLACDFYVLSAHKLYGPDGVGALFGRGEALLQLRHWQFGGEMVRVADFEQAEFHAAPLGFEAGTPPIAGVIALGASLDYLAGLDAHAVQSHEQTLHDKLLDGLRARRGVRLLGSPQVALASFVVEGVHHADLSHLLVEQGIAVRSGNHCAMPLMKTLGLGGAIRVSLGLYNDESDLQRLFTALDAALELLR